MNIKYNSQMSTGDMKKFCRLGEEEEKLIKRIFAKKRLTARGYSKILKTARTIADIDGNVNITTANISEAFYYRNTRGDNTLKKQYTRQEVYLER